MADLEFLYLKIFDEQVEILNRLLGELLPKLDVRVQEYAGLVKRVLEQSIEDSKNQVAGVCTDAMHLSYEGPIGQIWLMVMLLVLEKQEMSAEERDQMEQVLQSVKEGILLAQDTKTRANEHSDN